MRQHLFIIDENVIKTNLDACVPPGSRIHLIGSKRCLDALSAANRERFSSIQSAHDFTEDELVSLIESRFSTDEARGFNLVTNDECVEVVIAKLRERYGIEGMSVARAEIFASKLAMKNALAADPAISCPKYMSFDPEAYRANPSSYLNEITSAIPLPFVVKPVDGTSSSGVKILGSTSELSDWCARNSTVDNFEIEEYIEGILCPVDSLVYRGEILQMLVGEGTYPCLDYINGKNIGVRLIPTDDPLYERMNAFNRRVFSALQPPDGALHMEVFVKPDGELVFLEMSARPGGADLAWMYEQYNGVHIEWMHFAIRTGNNFEYRQKAENIYAAFCLFPPRRGTVKGLNEPDMASQYEMLWDVASGDTLDDARDLASRKAGSIRIASPVADVVAADFRLIKDFIPYTLESDERQSVS